MQYTIRNIPPGLDRVLRRIAKREGRSLNDVVIAAMSRAVGAEEEPIAHRRLDDLAGTWEEDPEFDAAIEAQDRIDPALWR
jgi:plasmid stability protein